MSRVRTSNLWAAAAVLSIIFGLYAGDARALSGSGTEADPWRIQSFADFDEFAGDPNYWDDHTRLETDVNLAGRIYTKAVIGSFRGLFDGNDHKIRGLTIDDGGAGNIYLGLFASIDYPGVRNLGIEGGSINGGRSIGALVGYVNAGGRVENCYSTAHVNGSDCAGGLVGHLEFYGSIVNCYSTGNVRGGDPVGGLVGFMATSAVVTSCYSTADVNGEDYVGGLVGLVQPPLKSGSTGQASDNSYASPSAKSLEYGIYNCYATGDVNGVDCVGGLVGLNSRSLWNCYSTGKVRGIGRDTGGLFGANGARGTVGCGSGRITSSYWDTQTSGQTKMCGDGTSCSYMYCSDTYGRTTAQMKQQATFTNWDFVNIWDIGENQTYPHLRTVLPSDLNKDKKTNFLDLCIVAERWCNEE